MKNNHNNKIFELSGLKIEKNILQNFSGSLFIREVRPKIFFRPFLAPKIRRRRNWILKYYMDKTYWAYSSSFQDDLKKIKSHIFVQFFFSYIYLFISKAGSPPVKSEVAALGKFKSGRRYILEEKWYRHGGSSPS